MDRDVDVATNYIPFWFTSKELGLASTTTEPATASPRDRAGWELANPMDEDGEPFPDGWPEGFGPGPSVGMRPGYSVIEATNWYAYVSNNPVRYVDPTGMFDAQLFVEGEVALRPGYDVSGGITIDLDNLDESGITASYGPAYGGTAGIGIGVALYLREAEGEGVSIDYNFEGFLVTIFLDDEGFNGFGFTLGPGIGGALSFIKSKTWSFKDILLKIASMIPSEIDLGIPLTPSIPLQ